MKSLILCLILLSTYCCCERLLGGWSTLQDDSLKSECLNKALAHVHGGQVSDEIRSQASDLACESQVVNGLNIKCSFVTRGEKWKCSYYKSFVQTLDVQLEKCEQQGDQSNQDEEVDDNKRASNENENENENEEQEQPLIANENEEAEQQQQLVKVPSNEKENQGAQEAVGANENEDDDEAAVDARHRQMSGQFSNNEEEQKKK